MEGVVGNEQVEDVDVGSLDNNGLEALTKLVPFCKNLRHLRLACCQLGGFSPENMDAFL